MTLQPLPTTPGGFGCILADPPWRFVGWNGEKTVPTVGADPYPTMTREALLAMPVADVAARDCALFMWVLDSHVPQALELGAAWGFRFSTAKVLTWFKTGDPEAPPPIGMGHWTRAQTEQALLFTRGAPRRLEKGVREVIYAPRREHSRKPDEQYDRVMRLVRGPYLELFARQAWPVGGWTAWGNQVGKFQAEAAA